MCSQPLQDTPGGPSGGCWLSLSTVGERGASAFAQKPWWLLVCNSKPFLAAGQWVGGQYAAHQAQGWFSCRTHRFETISVLGTLLIRASRHGVQTHALAVTLPWTIREGTDGCRCVASIIPRRCPSVASPVVQLVKNLPAMWKTWVRCLGLEDPLEKGKATHCSILA